MSTAVESRLPGAVAAVHDEAIDTRRRLHREPELSYQEHRTAALIATRCQELGYAVREGVGGTGVIADLDSGRPGPAVMVRADIDALPIQERGEGRVARSQHDGVMHACGHDGHVAIALGVVGVLATVREQWRGRVRLCFQPAEEVAGGALPMIEDGALEDVDRVLGLHLWAPLPVGRVGVRPGVIFSSADRFALVIRGRGGHGGMPHTSIDPIAAAAQVISALQTIVSRETSPFAPGVVTIGRVDGGSTYNVIAEEVRLEGTARAMVQAERERILRRVEEIAAGVTVAMRCESRFERGNGCPPVGSDAAMAELVRAAAVAAVGDENVDTPEPVTVGDDVAYFLERVPGCYFLVGAGDPRKQRVAPHHHPEFDIDERCLDIGIATLARATLAALELPA